MFDASNRQACRVRLAATSTPLHALTMLNDPTWVEAARALAQHCMQTGATLDEQLTAAFRRVLCRPPAEAEMTLSRRAHEKQMTIYGADLDGAKALLSVGTAQRDESLNVSEHAALAAVCLGIMNLDEALTRE